MDYNVVPALPVPQPQSYSNGSKAVYSSVFTWMPMILAWQTLFGFNSFMPITIIIVQDYD